MSEISPRGPGSMVRRARDDDGIIVGLSCQGKQFSKVNLYDGAPRNDSARRTELIVT